MKDLTWAFYAEVYGKFKQFGCFDGEANGVDNFNG